MKVRAGPLWATSEYDFDETPDVRVYQCNEFDTWLKACVKRTAVGSSRVVIPTINVFGFTCASDTVRLEVTLDYTATRRVPEDARP
jgi:hypothetical protein